MSAYYNEIDPYAAQWLRNLIEAGHIAPGYVDERSIEDVRPNDLAGFTQCHFFAGIGVWSLALRRAGWPDSRPVWTGSCPCQPFSAAGKGNGFTDERHLWPAFHYLIQQRSPVTVIGEQVASKDADPWIDLVQDDMEALGYTFGAVPFPSASVGAPHIRDRLYWVGDANNTRSQGRGAVRQRTNQRFVGPDGLAGGVGNASDKSRERGAGGVSGAQTQEYGERFAVYGGMPVGLERAGKGVGRPAGGPTNGHWRDADWLLCRDEKWRPVEPSTFPLAHGTPARVGRLRAYGNAINAVQAQIFIECLMD